MKEIKLILSQLVKRYLDNQASSGEQKLLNDFTQSEYKNAAWEALSLPDKSIVEKNIWDNISMRKQKPKKLRRIKFYKYGIAASILLIVGGYIINFNVLNKHQSFKVIETASVMDSIQLEDGSKVFLSPHSVFKYPKHFEKEARNVELVRGNAFFKVSKNPQAPFSITSGDIITTVLGTSFDIKYTENSTEVQVATGKVSVTSSKDTLALLPEEKLVYKNKKMVKQQFTTNTNSQWFKKDISFKNSFLKEIVEVVEYRYGIAFSFKDPALKNKKLTLDITNEDDLSTILDHLSFITQLKFERHDHTVTVATPNL